LMVLLSALTFPTRAANWGGIQGNVRTGNGAPVCALVLANGQYMFSCDGNGTYSLNVPLDDQGQVTLFAFADGFAPFRVTAAPAKLPAVIRTITADPDSPLIFMGWDMACAANNWVHLSGEIESEGGDPLCALVLANGQHMFSCGASQGRYALTVPADEKGEITLFGFADGFQPYSEIFRASNCGPFFDAFEDGDAADWQETMISGSGGSGSTGVELHNESQMAFVKHSGGGQHALSRDFEYSADDNLSFEMHAVSTSVSIRGTVLHSRSGVTISFLNGLNVPLASLKLVNATDPSLLDPDDSLIDGAQHEYTASMSEFAAAAGLDTADSIAKISLGFFAEANYSWGGNIYPNGSSSATVWFDDVAITKPSDASK